MPILFKPTAGKWPQVMTAGESYNSATVISNVLILHYALTLLPILAAQTKFIVTSAVLVTFRSSKPHYVLHYKGKHQLIKEVKT